MKVSSLYGDFHGEPEGAASSRVVEGGMRRPDHSRPGGDGPAPQCSVSPAAQGALSGTRGARPAARQSRAPVAPSTAVRDQITHLMQTVYVGFNDSHLTEKLREQHHLAVGRESVRRCGASARPASQRARRAPRARHRRAPEEARGMLIQIDGSAFPWLQDRGASCLQPEEVVREGQSGHIDGVLDRGRRLSGLCASGRGTRARGRTAACSR